MAAPPWFPFYHGDWIRSVSHLPLDVQGAYMRLLCHQWEHGGLQLNDAKIDIEQVARICGVSRQRAAAVWSYLGGKFSDVNRSGPEHLAANRKLESIRAKSEKFFQSQVAKAMKGAEARWGKRTGDATGDAHRDATGDATGNAPGNAPLMPLPQPQPDLDLSTSTNKRVRTPSPQKSGSAGHSRSLALIQPRDKSAFWEGPVFNIPQKWAVKALKAANGSMTEQDMVVFARQLSARVEGSGEDVSGPEFLGWLDAELKAWRTGRRAGDVADQAMAEAEARRRSVREGR